MKFKSKNPAIILALTLSSLANGYTTSSDSVSKASDSRNKITFSLSGGYGLGMSSDHGKSFYREMHFNENRISFLYDKMSESDMSFGAGYKADMLFTINLFQNMGLCLGFGYSRREITYDRTEQYVYADSIHVITDTKERILFTNFPIRAGIALNTRIGKFIPYSNISFYYVILGPYNDDFTTTVNDSRVTPSQYSVKSVFTISADNGMGTEWTMGIKYPISSNCGLDLSIASIKAVARIRSTDYKTTVGGWLATFRTIYDRNDSDPDVSYEKDTATIIDYDPDSAYLSFDALVLKLGFYLSF